jgi:hypothetical protein
VRPRRLLVGGALTVQTIGMVGFGAVAVAALLVDPTLGAYLVAFGLLGHGAWVVAHHRRDVVVPRADAEFCAVLNFLLAAAIVVLI